MRIPSLKEPFRPIQEIIGQGVTANILQGALELKMFDALDQGGRTAPEVAALLGIREDSTEALLDVLASMGLLSLEGGVYANTPMASEYLNTGSPAFQGSYLNLMMGHYDQVFLDIPRLLREGSPDRNENRDMWASPEMLQNMGQASMHGTLQNFRSFVLGLPGFSEFRRTCDLAGNHGFYTMSLLEENPNLTGLVVDLPKVVDESRKLSEQMGYGDRIGFKALDLGGVDNVGEEFDLVFASHILYGWKDNWDGIMPKIAAAVRSGGFFVSNHSHYQREKPHSVASSVMELSTRLAGYPSHHIGRDELTEVLGRYGFREHAVSLSDDTFCLLYAARKV